MNGVLILPKPIKLSITVNTQGGGVHCYTRLPSKWRGKGSQLKTQLKEEYGTFCVIRLLKKIL
jgi:hypothetical protein